MAGLWKTERVIASEQKNEIILADGREVINMCANNYLGLANNPEVIQADVIATSDGDLACLRCVLYAAHKPSTKAWNIKSVTFSDGRYDTLCGVFDANTVYSRLFSEMKMP